MKKITAIVLIALMLLSLAGISASSETTAPELLSIENVQYITLDSEKDADIMVFDTEPGNNDFENCHKQVLTADLFTKFAKGDLVHGETVTAKTYSTPVASGAELPYATVKLTNGEDLKFLYGLKATLEYPAEVTEIQFYMQGYKPGILDRQFTVLVSTDGNTWEKVFSAGDFESLVNEETGLLSEEGLSVYSGAINVPGAQPSSNDPATRVTVPVDSIKDVKYVMWTSNATRFNNSHYSARFTEVSVYGISTVVETTAAETTKAEETAKAGKVSTKAAETTAAPEATAATEATQAATQKAEDTKAAKKSGCGSSLAALSVAVVTVFGCAVIRKKH